MTFPDAQIDPTPDRNQDPPEPETEVEPSHPHLIEVRIQPEDWRDGRSVPHDSITVSAVVAEEPSGELVLRRQKVLWPLGLELTGRESERAEDELAEAYWAKRGVS